VQGFLLLFISCMKYGLGEIQGVIVK